MNKPRMDFSNIFSPKCQKVIAKRKGSVSPQLSSSKPKVQREFVTNVPTIQGFKMMTKIKLSDKNVQNILQTLEIETKASRQKQLRTKTNKLYLNYTHNPLAIVDFNTPLPKKQGSILTAIENLNKRDPSASMKTRILPLKSEINDLCIHLRKQIQKTMRQVKHQSSSNMAVFKYPDGATQVTGQSPFEQLDEITNLKDDYFFAKYYAKQQRNIFQLINEGNHRKFKSNREILDGYNFCKDSIWLSTTSSQKKVANKLSLNHLEYISSFSREMARGVIPNKLPDKLVLGEGDIGFNLEELHFLDIMAVATNKLTSRALDDFFREEEEDLVKKANDKAKIDQIDAPSVLYAHDTKNRRVNFNPVNQDKTEIEYFHKSPFTNIEQRQDQLSRSYQAKLKETIEDETMVMKNTIKDERVLSKFKKKKQKTLMQHLEGNVDKRLTLLMREVERKIRSNKMNKNRTEKIKIELLTQSFRMKRALETSVSKSKDKKDRQFSPLKTWRG